ncbi:MAG: fructosamine kinase family protein, partial [Alphaproteobacteria bacterium]
RLMPHLPHVPPPLARRLETLARNLSDRLPANPPPALLHGDRWSGNILAAGHRIVGLIDPACYYGHGEVDLAMLALFGPSPGSAFYNAYGALQPGYEERRNIYQLWPALVHLRLFGSGYLSMVERLLTAVPSRGAIQ